jgi:poly(3-hydroxybutyrate) depolymerase
MKNIFILLLLLLNISCAYSQPYNISDDFIAISNERSNFYIAGSSSKIGFSYKNFLENADKNKPVFIHSHGCGGIGEDESVLRDFHTMQGNNFVVLNFVNRGDAGPCTHLGSGNLNYKEESLKYISDLRYRIPARLKELEHHIKLLRNAGFLKIFVSGHSEGGMVVQRLSIKVNGAIIHSMTCFPIAMDTSLNNYLHLVSTNDPMLTKTPGRKFGCDDRSNYTVAVSDVRSHGALADASWKEKIGKFISDNIDK